MHALPLLLICVTSRAIKTGRTQQASASANRAVEVDPSLRCTHCTVDIVQKNPIHGLMDTRRGSSSSSSHSRLSEDGGDYSTAGTPPGAGGQSAPAQIALQESARVPTGTLLRVVLHVFHPGTGETTEEVVDVAPEPCERASVDGAELLTGPLAGRLYARTELFRDKKRNSDYTPPILGGGLSRSLLG